MLFTLQSLWASRSLISCKATECMKSCMWCFRISWVMQAGFIAQAGMWQALTVSDDNTAPWFGVIPHIKMFVLTSGVCEGA